MNEATSNRRHFLATVLASAGAIHFATRSSAIAQEAAKPAEVDPLPSWNKGRTRGDILDFVACATDANCPNFIPEDERIAVFDNDGTLWCEQPFYTQLAFVFDRIHAQADKHPEWKTQEPFAAVLKNDLKSVLASGDKGLMQLLAVTHAGMTTEEFEKIVSDWLATARHPKFKRPYTEMVYQPMLELLAFLRSKGFKTYIVSGGGIEFMRPFTEKVYGIPPEQVVGSSGKLKYELVDGQPVLMKLPEIDFIDDNVGKPIGIQRFIGRRPVLAFGNSDGDYEMLRWTTAGKGPRIGLIVHHTDAEREYAYDRDSHVGRLARALDEAPERGWTVVDMKRDWKTIFPPAKE
ncbi:HAD family hydrolase [Anatilimnocola sp. NA78]|uniref:HAD family hydrolase n=1 Tax=Anatilimnocola sp. NA78 TaxID=3415683 RepID=UPI003CE48ED9